MARPKKSGTKTNAERQKEYREKQKESYGKQVLNTYLNSDCWVFLKVLSFRYGVTKKKMLEMLIEAQYKKEQETDPNFHQVVLKYLEKDKYR